MTWYCPIGQILVYEQRLAEDNVGSTLGTVPGGAVLRIRVTRAARTYLTLACFRAASLPPLPRHQRPDLN